MVDMYKQVSDATAFVRGDGSRLNSLKALEMALYTMTDGEFYHHVQNGRNDFANWILHVFNQKDLALRLMSSTTRVEMLSILDDASRPAASASVASSGSSTASAPSRSHSSAPSKATTATTSQATSAATTSASAKSAPRNGRSFHHKLKGMFKKGEPPVAKHNAHSYEQALQSAKIVAQSVHAADVHADAHNAKRTIHEQINHLDAQLAHMTRHHAHTTARDDIGTALLEESVKERILDFSLGLIVGLMLGFILAKSLGL